MPTTPTPLAGSGVIALTGWRGVFWVVAVAAIIGLAAMVRGLPETRNVAARSDSSLGTALKAYVFLLRDWHYLGLVFIGGCAMAGFFVYLAGSPFVLINYYGLSSTQYSMAFALNSIAFIGAAQLTGRLGDYVILPGCGSAQSIGKYLVGCGAFPVPEKLIGYINYEAVGIEFCDAHGGAACSRGFVVRKEGLPQAVLDDLHTSKQTYEMTL